MQQPEVLGTPVSVNESGRPVLAVYVDRDAAKAGDVIRDLPKNVHGIDVQRNVIYVRLLCTAHFRRNYVDSNNEY